MDANALLFWLAPLTLATIAEPGPIGRWMARWHARWRQGPFGFSGGAGTEMVPRSPSRVPPPPPPIPSKRTAP